MGEKFSGGLTLGRKDSSLECQKAGIHQGSQFDVRQLHRFHLRTKERKVALNVSDSLGFLCLYKTFLKLSSRPI